MASPEAEKLIERAEREADEYDFDLEAIREIDSDADGTTIRVLESDVDSEKNQVGFQVTKPPGEFGDRMFSKGLTDKMRALRDHIRSDDNDAEEIPDEDSATVTETPAEDPRQSTDEQTPSVPNAAQASSGMDLTVALDEDSLEDLQEEFDRFLQDVDDVTVDHSRVDELEENQADIDKRLASIEEKLSLLAPGDGGDDE